MQPLLMQPHEAQARPEGRERQQPLCQMASVFVTEVVFWLSPEEPKGKQ